MRGVFWVVLLSALTASAAESAQAQQVLYKIFQNSTEGVVDWINTDCGPDEAAAVRGYVDHAMSYRGGRRWPNPRAYTVHVWCRADHSEKVWESVSRVRVKGNSGVLPMTDLIRSKRIVFISNRAADPRLAEVILFRK